MPSMPVASATAAMSATLSGGGNEAAALQRVAESVVPVLGEWAIVSLVDEDGRMRDVGSWHVEAAQRADVARYADLRLAAIGPGAPIMLDMTSTALPASQLRPSHTTGDPPVASRLVLVPATGRSDELVRRYRLARLRLEPRDVRGEQRFDGIDSLVARIELDVAETRAVVAAHTGAAA